MDGGLEYVDFSSQEYDQQISDPVDILGLDFADADSWTYDPDFFNSINPIPVDLSAPVTDQVSYNLDFDGSNVASCLPESDREDVDNAETNGVRQNVPLHSDDPENVMPNHYGVGYWLSICSSQGIAWVCHQVGSDEFVEIARELKASWAKQLSLEPTKPEHPNPEPGPHLAWEYSNAYFERSVDHFFGAVHRPEFERHLRVHLAGRTHYHDSALYALRNAVYAVGCRVYSSENPAADFENVHREAWAYFSKSLSVHSELLLSKPTLRSVRALLSMALFAEGLASPALSSGLVSNAALLALSLGLHREPSDGYFHKDSDAVQRIWLFWAVYCCEKHIAQRCGRPSVINDDDISCSMPAMVPSGSVGDLDTIKHMVQSCQLYGRISRQLLSTRALHEAPAKMLRVVTQFDAQLQLWKNSLPLEIQPLTTLKQFRIPDGDKWLGHMITHCSYYDLLMITHSSFMYPWVIESFAHDLDEDLAERVQSQTFTSSCFVANAARSLIVIARNVDLYRAGTQSFVLQYPMHAFINLFIYVLLNPTLASVPSDLALLDVAAGYFGQMEFVTSSRLRFPFARDIAALARARVDAAITKSPSLSERTLDNQTTRNGQS